MRLSDQIRAIGWAFVDDRRTRLDGIADDVDKLDAAREQAVSDLAAVRTMPRVAAADDARKAKQRKLDIFNLAQDWAAREDGTPNYIASKCNCAVLHDGPCQSPRIGEAN